MGKDDKDEAQQPPPEPQQGGDTLKDASDEMVRFLQDTDEHHAGRGDYG